ncbi:MAG: SDR family NAD(P)-dependent oxidoreductase [Chitinophagaceae bacterium]|nr:MAG: SDR family NAD(P)-dependent oxidoreductase [Chitinophagaceae bacterium]
MKKNNYQGALQQPINSGFDKMSTAADVIAGIDLTGKVAIVTGGSTGIGLETAKTLAAAGATVIVPARDIAKATANLKGIENVEVFPMDLMNQASIDAFAQLFLASGRPLHLLINNAGIMWVPLRRDNRGFESQLVTNYLAQFQLTARLWPALQAAQGARVVNVSSAGHLFAAFNFEDPNYLVRPYETLGAYGQSKTASNLFALQLDVVGRDYDIRAYSLHPGSIANTELGREASADLMKELGILDTDGNIKPEVAAGLKTVPQGAATTIWCATSERLCEVGGVYCEDCNIAPLHMPVPGNDHDAMEVKGVAAYAVDETNAKLLWRLTEELTGITFPGKLSTRQPLEEAQSRI